jgi:hypothetical protein
VNDHEPSRWSDFFFDEMTVAQNDDFCDPELHAEMLETHAEKPERAIAWLALAFCVAAAFGVFKVVV